MRPICWLHISDIHLTPRKVWSQDVVLHAMCEQIKSQRADGVAPDFVLMTGDIASTGKDEEYALAGDFFDALSAASGVPTELIFCIPGNHDIDRSLYPACFAGARTVLQSQTHVDSFLAPSDDLQILLLRQKSYRRFHGTYFARQEKRWTSDGLAYVSHLTFNDIRLAILALNSAWLAEGGLGDHRRLLIGEHQAVEAIRLAQEVGSPPHIILGMAHHPFHLLQEFDRLPVLNRIERVCQFLHCGHLHEPEVRTAGLSGTGCLTLTAGASFLARESDNSYSVVKLDLLHAVRTVTTVQYNRFTGRFSAAETTPYPADITPTSTCAVSELAEALGKYHNSLAPRAHYLSAVLLDQKAELPIPTNTGHAFSAFAVVAETESPLRAPTVNFMTFRNVLRVLYGRLSLVDILDRYGDPVAQYGIALEEICRGNHDLHVRLDQHEADARALAGTVACPAISHTEALLAELAEACDWTALRKHAERHLDSPDPAIATRARRTLALALAHSEEHANKTAAIDLYRSLLERDTAEFTDAGNLVMLLSENGCPDEAKTILLGAIERFPVERADYFGWRGQAIVGNQGDRVFRDELEAAITQRKRQRE